MQLHLVDSNPGLVAAWRKSFLPFPEVVIRQDDLLAIAENTVIAPTNEVLDQRYTDFFGPQIQGKVRERVAACRASYMPVGTCPTVGTNHSRIPLLVLAPTFPPETVGEDDCYRNMRAILQLVGEQAYLGRMVFCPGLAAGDPGMVAAEMARAYSDWKEAAETMWLTTRDSFKLRGYLDGEPNVSDRKWRLFACASIRSIWDMISEPLSREAVEVAELFADGRASWEKAQEIQVAAEALTWPDRTGAAPYTADFVASQAVITDRGRDCGWKARWASGMVWQAIMAGTGGFSEAKWAKRSEYECGFIRDIFGNPFRGRPFIDPSLLTGTVTKQARLIYEERRFHDMTALGDLLEKAGCADADILQHCRQQEVDHVRGCWLLDLLLGQS